MHQSDRSVQLVCVHDNNIILFYLGGRWALIVIDKEYGNVDQIKYIHMLGNYYYGK